MILFYKRLPRNLVSTPFFFYIRNFFRKKKLQNVRQIHVFTPVVLFWSKEILHIGDLLVGAECSSAFSLKGVCN